MVRALSVGCGLLLLPFVERKALPSFFGADPDLLFLALVVFSLYGRRGWVLPFGIAAGLSRSLLSIDSESLLPVYYPLAAVLLRYLRVFLFRDHIGTLFLVVLVSHLPLALLWRGWPGGLSLMFLDALIFSFYTALFAPIAFFLFRFLSLMQETSPSKEARHVS